MGRALDWLSEQVAEAVTDIRRRVVEEPWFGKPLDGPAVSLEATPAPESPAPDPVYDAWAWKPDNRVTEIIREEGRATESPIPEQNRSERGIDF